MIEKTVESKSSDAEEREKAVALEDAQHVTLARALEEANTAREASIKIKGEMIEELELFRAAMREELKVPKKRKIDIHDGLIAGGLVLLSVGVAVAYHWSYALMVVGCFLVAVSIVPLVKGRVKPG